ncbi:putative quinol monooxygenase [Dactylosporangium sp. CA-233914]|uniref:putative quinol monooxygenase n=1 Tax=Dactylosporangium sp. CA-233914 TaxID=3239934 RepID=UPI003D91CE13
MSVVVVAEWTAKTGEEARVRAALDKLAEASRSEEGNIDYRVFDSVDRHGAYLILEEYVDEEALKVHRASEHFSRIAQPIIEAALESRRARSLHPA